MNHLTIGIPTFNRLEYLKDAIQSVMDQDYPDFELVICDNASDDGTWEFLSSLSDPRIRIFRNSSNLGMIANWERCINEARGDWFRFLMSDDVLSPNSLSRFDEVLSDLPMSTSDSSVYICQKLRWSERHAKSFTNEIDFEILPSHKVLNERRKFQFGDFPALPNSYVIRTELLKNIINEQKFKTVNEFLGTSGHCVDYFILHASLQVSNYLIRDHFKGYSIRQHAGRGVNKYLNDIRYHLIGDLFVNDILFSYKYDFTEIKSMIAHSCRTFYQKQKGQTLIPWILLFKSFLYFILFDLSSLRRSYNILKEFY